MRSPVRIWVAAPDNPDAQKSVGALVFFTYFACCYPVLTGERYGSFGVLNLEEPTGLFTVQIWQPKTTPVLVKGTGALVLFKAFSESFS